MLKKILYTLEMIITIAISALTALIYRLVGWVFQTWNSLSVEKLVYQLKAPMQGTNEEMVLDAVYYCCPVAIAVLILVGVICFILRKKQVLHVFAALVCIVSFATLWYTVSLAGEKLNVREYIENKGEYSSFIDDNYINPNDVTITFPAQKKNLIYIYLESMEATYTDEADGGGFQENYIPELTRLAQENEDFSGDFKKLNGGYPMPDTTWTVAAMFAQSSGLPLSIPIEENSMNTQKEFFPQVTALGDILEKEGYSQTLLIGSDAAFGGRNLLYKDHGDFKIEDYNYALEQEWIPEGYKVWWGYEDEKLFAFAKQQLLELADKDEPFNLTMLTVDTHFEDGYVCDLCEDKFGDNQYANVIACSSKQVAAFVRWIQEQDFYKDTVVVLAGDHQTDDKDFCQSINGDYVRKVYTAYINSEVEPAQKGKWREYTTFDYFPTTLAALGVEIEGNRLGLGTNLFSGEQTLTEEYGREEEREELLKRSKMMDELSSDIAMPENSPKATIEIIPYDANTGMFGVRISDFKNLKEEIQAVNLAVCVEGDEGSKQWMSAEKQEDGSYFMNVDTAWYGGRKGKYQIETYVRTTDGGRYVLGETEVDVE